VFLSLRWNARSAQAAVTLKRRMNAIKDSPEAVVALGILGAMGMSPTQWKVSLVDFWLEGHRGDHQRAWTTQPLYLAGQRIETLMFWCRRRRIWFGVSIFSYSGQVVLG